MVDRRVRGDDSCQSKFFGEFDDRDDVFVCQVGCDLDEEGHDAVWGAGLAAAACGLQNRAQVVDGLQVAQTRSVG